MNSYNSKPVIAVDYDETITDNTPYPLLGNIRTEARKYIPLLHEKGFKLVLWTARKAPYHLDCINKLKEENLLQYFDLDYNDKGASGKLIADFYIDDRSSIGEINWAKIYNYLLTKFIN